MPKRKGEVLITTFNAGHNHRYKRGNKYTSFDSGHRHLVNRIRLIALPTRVGGHSHRILRPIKRGRKNGVKKRRV